MKAKSSTEGLRAYELPWRILKAKGTVRLSVLPPLLARVKKAISKEKDSDLAFKFQLAEEDKTASLVFIYEEERYILTVELKQTLGTGDI